MSVVAPPVSVGLPVRNGMPYIIECLNSIREQSFGDFDLLVCDNASTDGTEEVAREAVLADPRIRYLRVESDSGASANFNRCFARTDGGLFTWVASDDRFLPGYLEQTVDHLKAHPDHAMCVPAVKFIDEAGIASGVLCQPVNLSSPYVEQRLSSYLDRRSWFMVYGLIRREALETTGLFLQRFGPDVILIWEMLLRFRIGTLPQTLLEYRRYPVKESGTVWRGLQPEGSGTAPRWLHLGLFKDLLESCDREGVEPAARCAGRRAPTNRPDPRTGWRSQEVVCSMTDARCDVGAGLLHRSDELAAGPVESRRDGVTLVTGAGGFIGRHVVSQLRSVGVEVVSIEHAWQSRAQVDSLIGTSSVAVSIWAGMPTQMTTCRPNSGISGASGRPSSFSARL